MEHIVTRHSVFYCRLDMTNSRVTADLCLRVPLNTLTLTLSAPSVKIRVVVNKGISVQ